MNLKRLEHALLTAGVVLGVWCAARLLEAHFVKTLPIPHTTETAASPAAPAPAPAPGTWLAKLEMPTLHLDATVLEGSDDDTLGRAAGHIEDTTLPDDTAATGNIGIAGHRDTIFRPLRRAKTGDPLTLTTARGVRHYRVVKTMIVGPDDVYVLDPTGQPTVTLVTCYPFAFIGHAPKRFIVQAELDEAKAAEAGKAGGAGGAGGAGK